MAGDRNRARIRVRRDVPVWPVRVILVAARRWGIIGAQPTNRRLPSPPINPLQSWRRATRALGRWFHPPNDAVHNERMLYLQVIPQGLFMGGAAAFVDVFLVRLGAPSWVVSLNASLPALVMMLAVLPLGAVVQRRARLLFDFNLSRILNRTAYTLMALLPFLSPALAPLALVALNASAALPAAVQNVCFTTVIAKATPPDRRARVLSVRWAVMGVSTALTGLLVGRWLDSVAFPLNYQVLFATSILAALGTAYLVSKLRLPPETPPAVQGRRAVDLRHIWQLVADAPGFRGYMTARILVQLGMSLGIGLLPLYRVRVLGASDAWLGVLLTVQNITQVGSYLALGRLLRRPAFRRHLWLSVLGMALMPLTTALATRPEMLLLPALIIGVFGAALNVFITDSLIADSPEEHLSLFVSVNQFVLQAISFVGPLLGAALAGATSIRLALTLASGVRIVGGLAFWWLGRQKGGPAAPRQDPAGDT